MDIYSENKWRLWEIDFLRGLSIILMIAFHSAWSLDYFNITDINFGYFFGTVFPKTVAGVFVVLVGISLTLSYSKIKAAGKSHFKKYLKRGLTTFAYGMIVTAASYLVVNPVTVFFGILHFVGIGIILAIPLLEFKKLNLVIGTILILFGLALTQITVNFPWLFWLGLKYAGFAAADYFPILPWFGLILVGIFIGNTFYPGGVRKVRIPQKPTTTAGLFCFLGRHSLLIYFIHMMVIIGIISIFRPIL
jgi:uncharacterized membrane protein